MVVVVGTVEVVVVIRVVVEVDDVVDVEDELVAAGSEVGVEQETAALTARSNHRRRIALKLRTPFR